MVYCANCGKEMKEGAKFCGACGTPVGETQVTVETTNAGGGATASRINIDKEEIEKISKGYFAYFMKTLKKPSSSFEEGDSINGIIQFVLLAFLQIFTVWRVTQNPYYSMPFGMIVGTLLFLVAFHFVPVLASFGMKKLVLKEEVTFKEVATQYGGMLSIVVALQLVVTIAALLSFGPAFMSFFLVLSSIFASVGFVAYNYMSAHTTSIDNLYIVVLTGFIVVILWSILMSLGAATVIDGLTDVINRYMYY